MSPGRSSSTPSRPTAPVGGRRVALVWLVIQIVVCSMCVSSNDNNN